MTRNAIALAAALAAALPFSAAAQPTPGGRPRPDVPEWARDRKELRQNAREAHDDRLDLRRAEALLSDYDAAARARRRRAMTQLEDQALAILRQEWREGQAELARDRGEVARSQQELHEERWVGDRAGAMEGRRELRDDRRDLRDDRRDAAVEASTLERVRQMGDALSSLRGRFRRGQVARKRELLVEMVQMARAEVRENRQEQREDRMELREDRRDR